MCLSCLCMALTDGQLYHLFKCMCTSRMGLPLSVRELRLLPLPRVKVGVKRRGERQRDKKKNEGGEDGEKERCMG